MSAKPWRIGNAGNIRPRAGTWPVAADRLPMRRAWVQEYEAAAASFSACTLFETIGSGITHPDATRVQDLHDDLCRATSGLPMA